MRFEINEIPGPGNRLRRFPIPTIPEGGGGIKTGTSFLSGGGCGIILTPGQIIMTKDGTQSCTEHFHSPKAGEMWLPVPGERIRGRYEILEKIGSGGFGAVFRARDLTLKKKVALKFLYPGVTANKKKFHRVRREINVSQKISDPRITRIFSLEGLENRRREQWFLVMELVEGRSLKDRLARRGVWSWEEFSPLFLDILEGVRSLHRHNIIHRDIKPSNIMIIPGNRIKLLDFGLSKEVDDPTVTTTMGEVVGSPAYISPEQLHREPVDQRSDIYQLSLVLYQALSAALPFSARSTPGDGLCPPLPASGFPEKDGRPAAPVSGVRHTEGAGAKKGTAVRLH